LEKRVEELKKVVFQAKLGTSYEKMSRFRQLALFMIERIDPKLRSLWIGSPFSVRLIL